MNSSKLRGILFAVSIVFTGGLAACGPEEEYPERGETAHVRQAMCPVDQDCEPEPEVTPPPPPPAPSWTTVADFNANGGFEMNANPAILSVPGWTPASGCSWGSGASAVPAAKYSGTSGLRLSKIGCRVESALVRMPDGMWNAKLLTSANAWGRPCPSEGCARVTVQWRDSAGAPVGGTWPTYVYPTGGWIGYNVVTSRPYNAVGLSVRFESLLPDGQGIDIDDARLEVY